MIGPFFHIHGSQLSERGDLIQNAEKLSLDVIKLQTKKVVLLKRETTKKEIMH